VFPWAKCPSSSPHPFLSAVLEVRNSSEAVKNGEGN